MRTIVPSRHRAGFGLIEVLIALALAGALLTFLVILSRTLVVLNAQRDRTTAEGLAAAVVDAARALPPNAQRLQTNGMPQGIILGSGAWAVESGQCARVAADANGSSTLLFPGDLRQDGTLTMDVVPPPSNGWLVTIRARATDLMNGYAVELRPDRVAIARMIGGTRTELAAVARAAPARHVVVTMAGGGTLRVDADTDSIAATDAAFSMGWLALTADARVAFTAASWTDVHGTTTWPCVGTGPLDAAWAHLTTGVLRDARATLTVIAASDPPGTRALTGTVTWMSSRGPMSASASAVVPAS